MGIRYLEPPNIEHKPTIKKIKIFFHFLTKLNNFYVIGNIIGWLQMFFESQKQRSKEENTRRRQWQVIFCFKSFEEKTLNLLGASMVK
jgi:hypothetical protein